MRKSLSSAKEKRTFFGIYKNDTQWLARYVGELTKVPGAPSVVN